MSDLGAEVWREAGLVARYLETVRGAIPLAETQMEVMIEILGTSAPVWRFLDLGCGDGILAAVLLQRYPDAKGVLVDFSEPMIEAARQRLDAVRGKLEFLTLDYGQPEWVRAVQAGGPYEAIVSGYSIHHQPDERKRGLCDEIYELLAPGGWFVNLEHVAPATVVTSRLFDDAFVESIVRLQERQGLTPDPDEIRRQFVNREDKAANILAPVELQCQWLRDAGFTDVDCYLKVYELAVFAGKKPTVANPV